MSKAFGCGKYHVILLKHTGKLNRFISNRSNDICATLRGIFLATKNLRTYTSLYNINTKQERPCAPAFNPRNKKFRYTSTTPYKGPGDSYMCPDFDSTVPRPLCTSA
jgi:hypothetical protein